ncbi:MAG: phytanoyl-CoA dioxygenase family protein [Planctomycetes bacterium]|nr:phytanoyl-CoA dioxygenase family protein [Planctomycetota bacterium]
MITETTAALRALGVHHGCLTAVERHALDHDGYVVLAGVLAAGEVAAMRAALEDIFEREGVVPGGPDCDFLEDRSPAFDVCLTEPRFLAAIAHILGTELVSSGVHARPNIPGTGAQGLHQDYSGPVVGAGAPVSANSLWMLDDFTVDNGATRVVPRSHHWSIGPADALADPLAPHPSQLQICAPAGSVAVFNGHLWHSSCVNRSDRSRANVTSFWRRRSTPHVWAAPELRAEALARLPPAARVLCRDRSQVTTVAGDAPSLMA